MRKEVGGDSLQDLLEMGAEKRGRPKAGGLRQRWCGTGGLDPEECREW